MLVFMLAPFAMSVTGCFTLAAMMAASAGDSSPQLVPAGDAAFLDLDREIKLHLRNGTTVHGRFRGRTLLDPEIYKARFTARFAAGGWSPLALGESLTMDLLDGRRVSGAFAGYGMRSIVLRSLEDSVGERVPLRSATSIRHALGGLVSIDSLLAAEVRGELPSAEALAIRAFDTTRGISGFVSTRQDVPLEEVQMATVYGQKKEMTGLILFGVAIDVVLFLMLKKAADDAEPGCALILPLAAMSTDVRLTDRPFDRRLGRFVGEDVAWGDSMLTSPAALEAAATPLTSRAEPTTASPGGDGHATGWR
jgi:hypothetical protein